MIVSTDGSPFLTFESAFFVILFSIYKESILSSSIIGTNLRVLTNARYCSSDTFSVSVIPSAVRRSSSVIESYCSWVIPVSSSSVVVSSSDAASVEVASVTVFVVASSFLESSVLPHA